MVMTGSAPKIPQNGPLDDVPDHVHRNRAGRGQRLRCHADCNVGGDCGRSQGWARSNIPLLDGGLEKIRDAIPVDIELAGG